jgi:hypothetical protein
VVGIRSGLQAEVAEFLQPAARLLKCSRILTAGMALRTSNQLLRTLVEALSIAFFWILKAMGEGLRFMSAKLQAKLA